MKKITYNENTDTPVTLKVYTNGKYTVEYGQHFMADMTHTEAIEELGACLIHSAECASLLDQPLT